MRKQWRHLLRALMGFREVSAFRKTIKTSSASLQSTIRNALSLTFTGSVLLSECSTSSESLHSSENGSRVSSTELIEALSEMATQLSEGGQSQSAPPQDRPSALSSIACWLHPKCTYRGNWRSTALNYSVILVSLLAVESYQFSLAWGTLAWLLFALALQAIFWVAIDAEGVSLIWAMLFGCSLSGRSGADLLSLLLFLAANILTVEEARGIITSEVERVEVWEGFHGDIQHVREFLDEIEPEGEPSADELSAWKTSMLRTQCSNLKLLNQFNDNQHIVKLLYLTFLGHCCALFIGQMLSSFIVTGNETQITSRPSSITI